VWRNLFALRVLRRTPSSLPAWGDIGILQEDVSALNLLDTFGDDPINLGNLSGSEQEVERMLRDVVFGTHVSTAARKCSHASWIETFHQTKEGTAGPLAQSE
jgi:hypothetical protein